jgi:ubiquinone/menaquinone biosynthesis C-methylase UbiE
MSSDKTQKELAFLYDLFVAPDWDERFAALIDEHLKLPKDGEAVYLRAGTGGHVLALQQRAGASLRFIGSDENAECVELAREKARAANVAVEFRQDDLETLALDDNQFNLIVANASLVSPGRLNRIVPEIVRIAKPDAGIAFAVPTVPSFGEFFSIYWEALHNLGLLDHEGDVERLIKQLPTVTEVEDLMQREGVEQTELYNQAEEFLFESGEAFVSAPLISDFLMKEWLATVPEEWQQRVKDELVRLIDEDRHEADFTLTVKATLIVGRKARSN